MNKYTVMHTGKPYATTIPEDAWQKLSEHSSLRAACRKIWKCREHLSPGTWDDHFRVITPDGKIYSMQEATGRVNLGYNY